MKRSEDGPYYIAKVGEGVPLPLNEDGIGVFEGKTFDVVIRQGEKRAEERKIFIRMKNERRLIPLSSQDWAMLTAVYRHNESINYPPANGKLGGDMPILYCDDLMRIGREAANEKWRIKETSHELVKTGL